MRKPAIFGDRHWRSPPDYWAVGQAKAMAHYHTLLREAELAAEENPGKTMVLNAKTLEVILVSDDPQMVAQRLQSIDPAIAPLFLGKPFAGEDVVLHHFCAGEKTA